MAASSLSLLLYATFVIVLFNVVASHQIIRNLPGFDGDLPFKLQTGYVGVGESEDVQLFYYFIESERSPEDDPLVVWLSGGPGCSALAALVHGLGPLSFDYSKDIRRSLPTLLLNPYSWTKVANVIFLDAPVGTGFSYANSSQGYIINDKLSAKQICYFLRKWLIAHGNFQTNPLYVAGDSYAGKIVPIIAHEISEDIDAGHQPRMNLKGYAIGNPVTDENKDRNFRILFAYQHALVTREMYESAKTNCKGDFVQVDETNQLCLDDLLAIKRCTSVVNLEHILEPVCGRQYTPRPTQLKWDRSIMEEEEDSIDFILSPTQIQRHRCRGDYLSSWGSNKDVQRAIGIREGTKEKWSSCNNSLHGYTREVSSTLYYHRHLINKGYRVLVYSGDQDLSIPYMGTKAWIESLNLTIESKWQPWFVINQVAGYWMRYVQKTSRLTFATVKGAGHSAVEYKSRECLAMVDKWFANSDL